VTHPDNDPKDINARWLWAWWRPQWDLRHGQPPACLVCAATGPLVLLDRQLDPQRTIVFRDMVAVCTPCAARAERLVAARTASSRRVVADAQPEAQLSVDPGPATAPHSYFLDYTRVGDQHHQDPGAPQCHSSTKSPATSMTHPGTGDAWIGRTLPVAPSRPSAPADKSTDSGSRPSQCA
jgi:hypothetical protein